MIDKSRIVHRYVAGSEALSPEEPDAGNLHVRVCEGRGWQHPRLLGPSRSGDGVRCARPSAWRTGLARSQTGRARAHGCGRGARSQPGSAGPAVTDPNGHPQHGSRTLITSDEGGSDRNPCCPSKLFTNYGSQNGCGLTARPPTQGSRMKVCDLMLGANFEEAVA